MVTLFLVLKSDDIVINRILTLIEIIMLIE